MTPIKVHNITMGDMGGMGGIRCYGWYSVLWVVFGAMGGIRCDNVKSGQKYENLL